MVVQNRHRVKVIHLEIIYDSTRLHKSLTGTTKLGLAKFMGTTIQSEVLLIVI